MFTKAAVFNALSCFSMSMCSNTHVMKEYCITVEHLHLSKSLTFDNRHFTIVIMARGETAKVKVKVAVG